jgi:hypothetical protein
MKKNSIKTVFGAIKARVENSGGILIICGIYAVISVILFLLMTGGKVIVNNDALSYIQPALHILRDGFFSTDGINPEYSRTPGYPLFLALVYLAGGTDMAVIVIQITLMTLKVYLFYKTLLMLGTPTKISLFGSALLLINVQSYGYSFSVMTEPLFGFLLILSLYWLVKYLYHGKNHFYFAAFSLALNYALLVRPILIYFNILLCAALLVLLLLKKTTIKCFALFLLCFALGFGGWALRNYAHSGVFIFTTINNNDVARLQRPVLTAYMNNMPYVAYPGYAEGISEANEENLLNEYPELSSDDLNEAQKSLLRGKYGFGFIKKHFGDYILLNLKGFAGEMFSSFGTNLLYSSTGMSKMAIIIKLVQAGFCVFLYITYLLFFAGFFINIRRNKAVNIGIFLLCAYLSIPGAIYATPRFRDPFLPLILLSAVYNCPAVFRFIRGRVPGIKRNTYEKK